jgi:predicted Fe-Mo cluster-binding NifX family protein
MDVSPSQEIENKVTKAIELVPGIEEFWDLRLRKAGPFIFGETKVGIRKFVSVKRAHEIANKVESKAQEEIPQLESFVVHVEPFKSDFHHLVIPVEQKKELDSPISDLFGRTPYFLFINLKDKTIKGHYFLKNPYQEREVRAGLAAVKLITKQKSDTLITKKIGEISFYALRDNLFDIYQTTARTAAMAINQFIKGDLKPMSLPTQKND